MVHIFSSKYLDVFLTEFTTEFTKILNLHKKLHCSEIDVKL